MPGAIAPRNRARIDEMYAKLPVRLMERVLTVRMSFSGVYIIFRGEGTMYVSDKDWLTEATVALICLQAP